MNTDTPEQGLRDLAAELGPFSVDRAGYIWMQSAKGGLTLLAQVRGWGYLTGHGHGALGMPDDAAVREQLRWGDMIVSALNAYGQNHGAELIRRIATSLGMMYEELANDFASAESTRRNEEEFKRHAATQDVLKEAATLFRNYALTHEDKASSYYAQANKLMANLGATQADEKAAMEFTQLANDHFDKMTVNVRMHARIEKLLDGE